MEKTTGGKVYVTEKLLGDIKKEMYDSEVEIDRTRQYMAESIMDSVGKDIMDTLAKNEKRPSWVKRLIDRISHTVL